MISIDTQINEAQGQQRTHDGIPVICITRSLRGGLVAPNELVQSSDLTLTLPAASHTVTHISRAVVTNCFIAVLADRNRIGGRVIETLHRQAMELYVVRYSLINK